MLTRPGKTRAAIRVLSRIIASSVVCLSLLSGLHPVLASWIGQTSEPPLNLPSESTSGNEIYLPILLKTGSLLPVIHIPFFSGQEVPLTNYHQAAIFWFGQVLGNQNYADVRLGYNQKELFVRLSVIDNHLSTDPNPDPNLTIWDSVTLYLDLDGRNGNALDSKMYRFIAQEGTSPSRTDLQAAYQGSAAGWNLVPLTFFSSSGSLAGGYVLTFHILFSSLGLSGPPQEGTNWGIALTLHDRDDSAGNILTDTSWPLNKEPLRSETWGQLSFGFPSYSPPEVTAPQTITIRNGLNGARVVDGVVGGNTLCGEGLDFWYEWGTHSYSGAREMNVQNEGRIDDWPCFSKFYITFPLESLPPGKTIVSATLTLHQSGQSTGFSSDPPEALNSLIQISEVGQDWDEATLSWNNGPLPQENVSQNWVGPITMEDWGKPWSWDVSRVVSSAYSARRPLRLAFYSADHYGPNGKYLLSSDAETSVRPVLTVIVGDLK